MSDHVGIPLVPKTEKKPARPVESTPAKPATSEPAPEAEAPNDEPAAEIAVGLPPTFLASIGPVLAATVGKVLRYPLTPAAEMEDAIRQAVKAAWRANEMALGPLSDLEPTLIHIPLSVDEVAQVMHEAQRSAVEARLVVRSDIPVQPFIEWADLAEDAHAGRIMAAQALLEHVVVFRRAAGAETAEA